MNAMKITRKNLFAALALPLVASLAGCTRDHEFQPVDMWNHSRLKPYEPNASQSDLRYGTTAGVLPAGTIARGQMQDNDALYTGMANGRLVTTFPIPVTEATLKRGQERYTIFCAPCHAGLGDGNGLIVTRGFAKPPDYMDPRVLNAPVGHYYDVITNGYGAMYSYAARVPVKDRWAIAAYIRLLQRTRAQGKNTGPTVPGGGIYENLKKAGAAGHSGGQGGHGAEQGTEHGAEPRGGDHRGQPGAQGEVDPKGPVPKSFIPEKSSENMRSGTGGGLTEPDH